jgi:hypothetical protein
MCCVSANLHASGPGVKYGMTVSQVAEVYGTSVGEIERILRKA